MEGNIFIYGEIDRENDDNKGKVVSLKSIESQLKANRNADPLIVRIHSEGGDVIEGWAIHDAILATGKEIITVNEGLVGSIATIPYLTAKKENRRSRPNARFFIHNPWGSPTGDSRVVSEYASELKREEDKISQYYALRTSHDVDDIIAKMNNETEFTAEQAIEMGFAGAVIEPLSAVAKYTPKAKSNPTDMSKIDEKLNEQKSLLDKILAKLGMNKKALAYTLDNGDVVETDSDQELAEGQVLMMDGTLVSEGTYVIEDGRSVTVDAEGVITSIVEPSEDEMDALKAENESLKAELETLKAEAKKKDDDFKAIKEDVEKLAKLQSTYKPKAATPSFKKKEAVEDKSEKESYEAIKARRKEKRNQAK